MKHLAKNIRLGLLMMSLSAYGQQPLTYQALIADKASMNGASVNQFDQLFPGDTIEVTSSGHFAAISNYFHSIEVEGDTLIVLPIYGSEDLGNAFERPDLKVLYDDKPFGNINADNAVDHAIYFMDLLYPLTASHVISPNSAKAVPIIWKDYRDIEQKREPANVSISNMFYEVIVEFGFDEGLTCLDLNNYPEALIKLKEDSFVILDFKQDHLNGRQFAIKLSSKPNWKHPFELESCKIKRPVYAVALALFLEYNYSAYRDAAKEYYERAVQLSTNNNYQQILDAYLKRH